MAASTLLHLTDLLPGVVLLVVLQDVIQIIWISDTSSCKYIVILLNIMRYNAMFNINIIRNVLTKYEDVILQ